jgi:hypothetical protein
MMMAHDSSNTPSRLDDETLNAVRVALRAYLHDANDSSGLQASLLLMANEARTRSILPEQLLIMLKDLWNGLPEVRSMHDTREQIPMLQRVVTMCIREYYSTV